MSKTIVTPLLPALAVAFTLNLHAEPAWTTGSYAPADWQPLDGNILLNVTGTSASVGATGYDSSDLAVLTNGSVPTSTSENKGGIFGFKNGENISWTFAAPKTLEQIRICTCYLSSTAYDGVHIAKVEAMFFGESSWTQVAGESQYNGESSAGKINYAVLTNGEGPVVQNIIGLRITFGMCETGFANYYTEIEAVGVAGATGPVIGSFAIAPAKTKAMVSGTITDPGTDATACDVYLALDDGAATKIAEGVTGLFEHQILGLTAGTTYAYELSVSNNAPTSRGTVQSGDFMTLASDASTAFWTTSEGVPGDFSPLADNLIANKTGAVSGGSVSGYGGGVELLTNGEVSGVTKQTCGLGENRAVEWSFDGPKTLERIRFTTCDIPDGRQYDDIKISKVEVKTAGSDSWADLGVVPLDYAGGNAQGGALFATLADAETGFLGQNVTAIRITFGKPNNFAQYYAEIEAVGHAADQKNGVIIYVL